MPKLVTVRDENGKVIRTYTEMTNVIPGVTGGLSILGSGMDNTAKKAKDAAKESDNFRIKMEEIASNERIKNIEAYVSLNVADWKRKQKELNRRLIRSITQSTARANCWAVCSAHCPMPTHLPSWKSSNK
ncbi:MAG: hypothetical protein HC883_06405 [Bdellovibrionaceae bacterium]|nr:hypothetical protein [Pseudobdellovibrionaceae bacterium]